MHLDVWGPSPVQTINGREYYSSYTDDFSRYTHLYLLRTKDQNFNAYKSYEAELWTQHGARIKRLRSDRGGEYLSTGFDDHLAKSGTLRSLTVHDTPEYNGVLERLNCTLLEKVRAMLHAGQLPKFLWGEAVKHAVYLKNRTSTKSLNGKMPYEVYFGKKPNIANLHKFGCKVWVHNTTGLKLDGRSEIGRWVGFDEMSNGHRIYWPGKHSVSIERSVKFDTEADIFLPNSVPLEGEQVPKVPKVTINPEQPTVHTIISESAQPTTTIPSSTVTPVNHLGDNFEHLPKDQGRPKRIRTESAAIRRLCTGEGVISNLPRERGELPRGIQETDEAAQMAGLDDEWEMIDPGEVVSGMAAAMAEADALEPSYEEAQSRSDWPEWEKAIQVELDALRTAGSGSLWRDHQTLMSLTRSGYSVLKGR